ncbi:MAG TPA: PilZ domain-containing protein [Bdellovibrionales bacterium]|nr:PilZ domain-containing protein [Bdellovibrionales bacterium]
MNRPQDQAKDRRRYPRIFLQSAEAFQRLVGGQVRWPGGSVTDVLDLSYTGAAVVQPGGKPIEKGQAVTLSFMFAGQEPVEVGARIMRADGSMVGLQFDALSSGARLAFETFLSDNLLGLSLRKVDPGMFRSSQDFNHWYHGPKDTNVFIWIRSGALAKAIIEIDNQILVLDGGKLQQGKSRADLISAIEDYYSPVLFESVRAGSAADGGLVARVVKLLSQAKEPGPEISWLLVALNEAERA